MEFNEKLQYFRKQKGMTQEELAQALYVSRTAVSKWESGKGYPGIDSLKALSAFFSVSIDELLSGDEVLNLAEEEKQHFASRCMTLVFGALDCAMALLFVLPFFGQRLGGKVSAVALLQLTEIQPLLKTVYMMMTAATVILGIVSFVLAGLQKAGLQKHCCFYSLALSMGVLLLLIISRQPYAALWSFVLLVIKGWMLLKCK